MAKKERKLSQILTETLKEYLKMENKPIGTLIDFDRIKDAIPIPAVNGVDSLEKGLTDANKEELVKVMQECYISDDCSKLMEFLMYAFPISYSNKGETITTMYNSLRRQLHKSEYDELTYTDMMRIFETGKPLERADYKSDSFYKQIMKKGRKGKIFSQEDKIRFLIQGYKVAKYFESHTEEMDHFRSMQEHFYNGDNKGVSDIDTEMLKELGELGFSSDDILLLRKSFYKGGSTDFVTNELIYDDIKKPSSALDSIEMRNVVEADEVLRSIFIGKYVREKLTDKNAPLSYYKMDDFDKKLFASFMSPDEEKVENILNKNVDMYAKNINALVNKIFKEGYDIIKYKPYLSKSKEDGWELEEYNDKELTAHKKTVRDAIVKSAISNGAFVASSEEEFMKRLAIACTNKEVTKHFCHAGLNAIARDEKNNFVDFESTFPDAANAPYASQRRKCGNAIINYEGTLYYVTNMPVVAKGKTADNVADDEWELSITDQELNALIVNLTSKYGISFGNLTKDDIIVGKNMAAFEASRMALGKDAKLDIETAFEMAKKSKTLEEEKEENPFVNHEDAVKDFTSYKDTAIYKEAYNKAMAEYKNKDSLVELIAAILPKVLDALQGSFSPVYLDRDATLDSSARAVDEDRASHLEKSAIEEEARDMAEAEDTSDAPYRKDVETLSPEEINKDPKDTPVVDPLIKTPIIKGTSKKARKTESDAEVVEVESVATAHKVKWEKGKKCVIIDGRRLEVLAGCRFKDLSNRGLLTDFKKTLEYIQIIQEAGIDTTEMGFTADAIESIRNIVNDRKTHVVLPTDGIVLPNPLEITDEDLKNLDLTIDDDGPSRLLGDYELYSDGHWAKPPVKSVDQPKVSVYQLRNSTNVEIDGKNYFITNGVVYDEKFKEVPSKESEKVKKALENNKELDQSLNNSEENMGL